MTEEQLEWLDKLMNDGCACPACQIAREHIKPIMDDLTAITEERDHLRTRLNDFETNILTCSICAHPLEDNKCLPCTLATMTAQRDSADIGVGQNVPEIGLNRNPTDGKVAVNPDSAVAAAQAIFDDPLAYVDNRPVLWKDRALKGEADIEALKIELKHLSEDRHIYIQHFQVQRDRADEAEAKVKELNDRLESVRRDGYDAGMWSMEPIIDSLRAEIEKLKREFLEAMIKRDVELTVAKNANCKVCRDLGYQKGVDSANAKIEKLKSQLRWEKPE